MAQSTDPYRPVQAELDAAVDASDPLLAAAAVRRAQLALARIAAGAGFDARRHRAISGALREVARAPGAAGAPLAPLVTR
jgi:hypothetical protein